MKRLLLLLVLCAGCTYETEIQYHKDEATGLCYAMINSGYHFSMTCVPCDSLKRIKTIVK